MTARHDFRTKLGRAQLGIRSCANKHKGMGGGGGGGGGGTYSAEVGQNPLAECVPPDRIS